MENRFWLSCFFSALDMLTMSGLNIQKQWKQADPVTCFHNIVVRDAKLKKIKGDYFMQKKIKMKSLYFGMATYICTDLSFKPKPRFVSTVKATEGSRMIFNMLLGATHIFFYLMTFKLVSKSWMVVLIWAYGACCSCRDISFSDILQKSNQQADGH